MRSQLIPPLLLLLCSANQAFLAAPLAGLCLPGNGFCESSCLIEELDHGGDCTREDLCSLLAGNSYCDAICFDYEKNTMDCICLPLMTINSTCDLACLGIDEVETLDCICDPSEMRGNGSCDVPCMQADYEWDWGECYQWS